MKLSIIIPCYNEEKNIPFIYNTLNNVIDENIEIILVNNGSTDNSQKIMESLCSNNSAFKICHVKKNQGYGYGIIQGLEIATGSILAWTHADLQTDPIDIITAYNKYFHSSFIDNFIVKGKRRNRRISEAFFTFGMQIVAFFYLGVYIDDINAQPKIFTRNFYEKYIKNKAPYDFSLDLFLLYTAKKNNYSIKTVPVIFKKRLYGEAKGGGSLKTRIKLIKRTFSYIRQLSKSI